MKKLILAACVALSIVGCKKDASATEGGGGTTGTSKTGTAGTGTDTAETPKSPDQAKPNPAGCNSDFAEPFNADVTLTEKCSPYTVKAELNVDGFAMTIEPGVELKFEDGQQMNIAYYKAARLIVKGTKEKPVKFTGRSWKGLRFMKDAAGSSVENAVFQGAGTEDSPSIAVETHDLSLNTITVTGAKKTAVKLTVDKPLKAFSAIDLSNASEDPSELIHARIATAGVFGTDSKFQAKSVIWLEEHVEGEVTLVNVGATYRLGGELNVDPKEDGKSASLTVKEGVTLELADNQEINIGYYKGPAMLKIQGTKEKPVVVTRYGEDKVQTPSNGIHFFGGARAPEIDFLAIEYAGTTDKAAVTFTDARGLGKITNSTFRHLKAEAIRVESAKDRFEAFDGNTFEDVEDSALRIPVELAHNLGASNKFTDKARVTLYGEAKKDTNLENIGAPYQVEGELQVNGQDTKSITLTIAPGNTLLFNDEGRISVAYYAPAKLVAKGTPEKPLTFGKLLTSWKGMGVYNKGNLEVENATFSGTAEDAYPLDLTAEVTGSVKKVTLKDTKKGIHACAKAVKPEGVTADKGVTAVEKCD